MGYFIPSSLSLSVIFFSTINCVMLNTASINVFINVKETVLSLLNRNEVNVNNKNKCRETALIWAAAYSNRNSIVSLLVNGEADVKN